MLPPSSELRSSNHHTDPNNIAMSDSSNQTTRFSSLVSRLVSYTSHHTGQPTSRQSDDGPLLTALSSLSTSHRSPTVAVIDASSPSSLEPETTPDQLEAGLATQPPVDGQNSVADSAARHRLASGHSIDIRALARSIEKALPFLTLFLIVFVYKHLQGLLLVAWCTFIIHRSNRIITQQVVLKDDLQVKPLVGLVVILILHCKLIELFGPSVPLWKLLSLHANVGSNFFHVLFAIVSCDLYLRFVLSCIKIGILLTSRCDTNIKCRKRGALFTAVDYCMMVYRAAVPAPLWLGFLQGSGLGQLMASGCSGVYLILKAATIMERISLALASIAQWRNASFGTKPTQEEVAAIDCCPICQESFRNPIRLQCSHIFCEDCAGEWLEREATCPMCRQRVRGQLKQMGDGSTALIPHIF